MYQEYILCEPFHNTSAPVFQPRPELLLFDKTVENG